MNTVADHNNLTDRIWLKSYPEGVPAEIDPDRYHSLAEVFRESVEKYRTRIAYVSVGTEMTYDECERQAKQFAAWLQSRGVKKGDRVAIMLPNSLQYPVCLFGTLLAGAIVVNVNPLYTVPELAHQLRDSGAQTIVVLENFARTLEQALPGSQVRNIVITGIGDLMGGALNLKGRALNFVMRHVQKQVPPYKLPSPVWLRDALAVGGSRTMQPVQLAPEDIAFLQYTGGTTGVAKGAMLTHRNIIANLLQAEVWSKGMLSDDAETNVTLLPLYHIFSLTVNLLMFMTMGGRNILIANPRDTKRVLFIHFRTLAVPYVDPAKRLVIKTIGDDIHTAVVDFGFKETPAVDEIVRSVGERLGIVFEDMETSFFITRATVVPSPLPGMAMWRESLFAWMQHNSAKPSDFFRIPANRLVELGSKVEI